MQVTVNGAVRQVPAGATVQTVVETLLPGHGGGGVAVARNGEVVPRSQWSGADLDSGDVVEVVTAFAGG